MGLMGWVGSWGKMLAISGLLHVVRATEIAKPLPVEYNQSQQRISKAASHTKMAYGWRDFKNTVI